ILPEIEICCDRVIIINQGHVVANGTSQSLREQFLPRTRYRVRTTLEPAKMRELLPSVSPELTLENTTENAGMCEYLMEAPSHLDLTENFIDALRARQGRIHEVARLQPNLEDIFMSATKRSWDETLPEDGKDGVSPQPVEAPPV
ncbi:MAG: hypothetical protein ACQKBW_11595, partial [Puniceicoccales bacterium]